MDSQPSPANAAGSLVTAWGSTSFDSPGAAVCSPVAVAATGMVWETGGGEAVSAGLEAQPAERNARAQNISRVRRRNCFIVLDLVSAFDQPNHARHQARAC